MLFGYRANTPQLRFNTDRMVVRLAHERDAYRISEYYCENEAFLKPWEPLRDRSHYHPSGWSSRLQLMTDMHRQGTAFHFLLLDQAENEVMGWRTTVMSSAACFTPVFSVIHWEKMAGAALYAGSPEPTLRYMQRQQGMHRIMANYMPHNQRSGQLLARSGLKRGLRKRLSDD